MKVITEGKGRKGRRVYTTFEVKDSEGNLLPEYVSKTQQQFKDQCDVNHIMKKYTQGKGIDHLNFRTGVYGDFTEIDSYADAMNTVVLAQAAFKELPAELRARFQNDPQHLMDFLNDPNMREESIKLGLRKGVAADPLIEEVKGLREDIKKTAKKSDKQE